MKNGVGIGAGESSFQCVWIENSDKTETEAQLQHVLRAWTRARPDTCLLSSDGQRVFTHRALFGLHSRMLRASLASLETTELAIISAPSSAKSLRNLSRLLLNGVVVSSSREDLKETEEAAACLGIELSKTRTQSLQIPTREVLTYSRKPLAIKTETIKSNIIDIFNPNMNVIKDILDEELQSNEYNTELDRINKEEFPGSNQFHSKVFSERIRSLEKSGTVFQIVRGTSTDAEDNSSFTSDSSGSVNNRRGHKRKLFGGHREFPADFDPKEETILNTHCDTCTRSSSMSNCASPRMELQQRTLYNSCENCMKRRAEENIKSIKQKKYFEMLRDKSGEKVTRSEKFPCDLCSYVAAHPSNLKTHKLANHEGVDFVNNYVNDYFDKNKFIIL